MTTASPVNQATKRLKMLDADGDATMNSSPERQDDHNTPVQRGEGDDPSTPRNAASFALGQNSELSPPPSNPPRDDTSLAALSGSPSLNVNGKRILSPQAAQSSTGNVYTDQETGYQWSKQEEQPGWEWKNQRAREEEQRALELIADQGAMIKGRYGDPLDPSIPPTMHSG